MSAFDDLVSRVTASLFASQQRRLLQLETALPTGTLVVERAQWHEHTSGWTGQGADLAAPLSPLIASVDCLSSHPHLSLKLLMGEQMSLRVMTPEGRYRVFHGYVVKAAQLGSDGGLSRYRLQLRAFTHLLSLRRDCRVFVDQRADQIITTVLAAYPQAHFQLQLSAQAQAAAPVRGITTQYKETDAAFVERLLCEEGWNWRLEHSDDGQPLSAARAARHCLVITDPKAERPSLGPLRFGRPDLRMTHLAGLPEDTLTALAVERSLQPNAITLGAWDPRQLAGVSAQVRSALDRGELPTLEIYNSRPERHHAQHRGGEDHADGALAAQRAELALARLELQAKTLHGAGAVRGLRPGATFTLLGHSLYGPQALLQAAGDPRTDNEFLVLSVQHEAANNLGSEAAQLLRSTDIEAGSYQNQFTALPAAATLVPPARPKPTVSGVQTALVVGHPGDTVPTERDLRLRIQFPWQRGASPLPGGLSAPVTPGQQDSGHAPGNASASQWVRVAQASAGANWGAVFMPRLGTEVLVEFLHGDIDRPLITGQLHNGQDPLPWPAGVDSNTNHPGTLSGWHSQSDDGGLNQWVIDDATGQVRMRLASLSPSSPWGELSLGHIIQQQPALAQRGAWLGSGFLGHTDGWASVRAAQGLLFSTTARPGTHGSAQGTQMDVQEAVGQLKGAQQLGQRLNDAAQGQGALPLTSHAEDPKEALEGLLKALDPQQDGRHAEQVKARGREPGDPVETFAAPHVVLDTPSAAGLVSPATIASFSGQDTSITAQGDVHATAGHTASLVSGQTTSLFTHEGELQAIAANGNLSLRAHTDQMEILADKSVTIVSVNGEITITAKERIELVGGDSKVVLDGANIQIATPGTFTVQAATHAWAGGASGSATLEALPTGVAGARVKTLDLIYCYADMKPVPNAPYRVQFADGTSRTGTLDAQGRATIENPPGPGRVFFGFDGRPAHPRRTRPPNAVQGSTPDSPEAAAQMLERYLAAESEYFDDNHFPDEVPSHDDHEDQVNDYEYKAEITPPEPEPESPGQHEEHLLSDEPSPTEPRP